MSKNTSALIAELSVGIGIASLFACSTISARAQEASTDKTIELQVGDKSYPVTYHFTNGGTINGIAVTKNVVGLRINLTSQADGDLEIRIPREASDAILFTVSSPLLLFVDRSGYVPNTQILDRSGYVPNTQIPLTRSCEQTSFIVPVKADYRQIELHGAVILAFKPHYPVNIEQMKTFEEAGQNFTIKLITDAKKCDASFSKEEKKIHIDIKGRDEVDNTDNGYFAVDVPHVLLDGNYSVLVDGKTVSFKDNIFSMDGNTEMFESQLSFNYTKEATKIDIIGTTAIPEFDGLVSAALGLSLLTALVLTHRVNILRWFHWKCTNKKAQD